MKKLGLVAVGLVLLGVPCALLWLGRKPVEERKPDPPAVPEDRESSVALDRRDAQFEDAHAAASRPTVNLLRRANARIVRTTALPAEAGGLGALTDEKPATVAEATASADAPLEVVYGFGGRTVTAEALLVRLPPPGRPGAATGRVDILVSTLSPHAGFRLVRSDPLARSTAEQGFWFTATGVRWLMLRFHPAGGEPRVAVAEVAVLGQDGPPASRYRFKESPARAIDVLARLKALSGLEIKLTAEEENLFEAVRTGKLEGWSFERAALLASGVGGDGQKKHLAKLGELERKAREAVAGAKTPLEKGEKLLRWLHDGPFGGGYEAGQTSLGVVLEDGKFNCVSSAALYNVLARRLGLDARAVEVPDHAFSIVYHGNTHADVETTTPRGFDPARDAVEEFRKRTSFVYLPDKHRDRRREVGGLGLAAIIYHNRGAAFARERNWHESLGYFFRALSLDPELHASVKNTLTVLALWGWDLTLDKNYKQALQVFDAGLELAPRDARLRHNRRAVWTQWALALLEEGKQAEALDVLRQAHSAVPDGDFAAMQAWVFIRKAEGPAREGKWQDALDALDPGEAAIDKPAAEEIAQYRRTLRLRWAQAEVAARRFEEAVDVLAAGLKDDPGGRLAAHLGFAVQAHAAHEGESGGRGVLERYRERFPEVKAVRAAAAGYVWSVVKARLDAGRYEGALKFIDDCKDLLGDPDLTRRLVLAVYETWSRSLAEKKDHAGAVEKYKKARDRFPDDPGLARRAAARLDASASTQVEAGAWDEALALYQKYRRDLLTEEQASEQLLYLAILWTRRTYEKEGAARADAVSARLMKDFPGLPDLRPSARRSSLEKLVHEFSKAGKYEQALAVIERAGDLAGDEGAARKVYFALLRQLSAGLAARPDREQALALLNLPELEARLRKGLTDPDGAVRAASADTLANLDMRDSANALSERLADERWVMKEYLNAELNDPVAGGKAAALAALRKLAPELVTPALLRVAGRARKVQWARQHPAVWACRELARQKDQAAFDGLVGLLGSEDGYVRRAAADALKERGDRGAAAALAERVADEVFVPIPDGSFTYRDEPYDGFKGLGSKDHALLALRALDEPRVVPALAVALRARSARVRAWAAVWLGKPKGPDAVAALAGALRDDSNRVRTRAAKSLGEHAGSKPAVDALIKALSDRDGYVRRAAADALKELGDRSAVPALEKRVADDVWVATPRGSFTYRDEPYDGFKGLGSKDHALLALHALDQSRVKAALEQAARSDNAEVKKWARKELAARKLVAAGEQAAAAFLTEDLAGWEGPPGEWGYRGGELTGSSSDVRTYNASLYSKRKYRDFELRFKVRLKGGVGNSAVQIRGRLADAKRGVVEGPQCEIGGFWGGLWNEGPDGDWMRRPREGVERSVDPKGFNDYHVKAVGKRVTIKVNGETAVDEEFKDLPDEGVIAFQLHGGSVMEVTFKDVVFQELNRTADAGDVASVPAPKGAVVLFDGKSLDGWTHRDGKKPAHWKVLPGGILQVEKGGDIMTRQKFDGRFRLHVEFRVSPPAKREKGQGFGNLGAALGDRVRDLDGRPAGKGQKRGNSGVYVQGRYEIQIIDSHGLESGPTDCGAIYGVVAPAANACKPAGAWQSFDIEFTAPVYRNGKKVEPARVTVYHNGVKIHDDVKIPLDGTDKGLGDDPSAPGPILLQELGFPVQFRNLWLQPLPAAGKGR